MSSVTYSVTPDAAGKVNGVNKTVDGNTTAVELSMESQDFCDFLTWDCQQKNPIDPGISPTRKDCRYFADLERLVKHCQARGLMLFVRREEDQPPSLDLGDTELYTPVNGPVNGTFHVLHQTVEDDDRTFHHETDGITSKATNICVSPNLMTAINGALADENSDVRKLSSSPITRVFVYIDVSDFSTMPPGQQALVINSITNITDKDAWEGNTPRDYEAKLCIGDGYIFVFRDAMHAVRFAGQLASLVEVMGAKGWLPVVFHFRIGIHIGEVYCFWDTGRKGWNYIGDGINGGQRVLAAVGKESDDVVFISEQVRRQIIAQSDATSMYRTVLGSMQNRGRKADKHGRLWRVFEVQPSHFTILKAGFQQ